METTQQERIVTVVITGAPCGGKSSVVRAVMAAYPELVVYAPEVPTMLMSTGFPAPGRDLEYDKEWQYHFQYAVLPVQASLEATCKMVARKKGARLLLCDRGMLDGAAYTGGLDIFCETYGIDREAALKRYDAVIHLETLAVSKPHLYGKSGNDVRYETVEQAIALDLAIREAWSGHANRIVIEGERSELDQNEKVLALIDKLLA